jgi:hypothetical protein
MNAVLAFEFGAGGGWKEAEKVEEKARGALRRCRGLGVRVGVNLQK